MTTKQPRTRRRRIVRAVLIGVGVVVLFVGGVAAWAVNRYLIEHVEISDVAAYEAAANATTTTAAATTRAASAVPTSTVPTVLTADRYRSGDASVEITKVVKGTGNQTVTYYVADVVLSDVTQLRSAFAENKFGRNIIANTSTIAQQNGALFAINGDYYGFRTSGIVIRNGVIFRDVPARQGVAFYRDGTMRLYDEKSTTAERLVAEGVWHTLSFGPGLLEDGRILDGIEDVQVDTNIGNRDMQGNEPRTAFGMIDENHFVFVVVDGRSTGYSRGITMTELAQIFQGLGATVAYNLDGGGSATMWFNGELVNNPLGKGRERGTSDILYFAADDGSSS
jgi:exopolysaccharide biosynthesis protein